MTTDLRPVAEPDVVAPHVFDFRNPARTPATFSLGGRTIRVVDIQDTTVVLGMVADLSGMDGPTQLRTIATLWDRIIEPDDLPAFHNAVKETRPTGAQLAEIADWVLGEYMRFPTTDPA